MYINLSCLDSKCLSTFEYQVPVKEISSASWWCIQIPNKARSCGYQALCKGIVLCLSIDLLLVICLQSVGSFGGLVFAAEEQSEGIIPVKTHGIHSKSSNGK